jgi:hypothetical protein
MNAGRYRSSASSDPGSAESRSASSVFGGSARNGTWVEISPGVVSQKPSTTRPAAAHALMRSEMRCPYSSVGASTFRSLNSQVESSNGTAPSSK